MGTHQTDPSDGFWVGQEMKRELYFTYFQYRYIWFFFSNMGYDFGT